MNRIKNCTKEWNATVEALGQGIQTILIRTYPTHHKKLLLCPTFTYTLKDDYFNKFKREYLNFVKENSIRNTQDNKMEIKYYIEIEKIIELPNEKLEMMDEFYIWTTEHVKSYLKFKNPYIWILRVHELPKNYLLNRRRGMRFSILETEIPLEYIKPVIDDNEFSEINNKIENRIKKIKY